MVTMHLLCLYTHTSRPLYVSYPDIVVHWTLAAVLEAEDFYLKRKMMSGNGARGDKVNRCFSGICFEKDEIESVEAQEAMSLAAAKYRVPETEALADGVAHCNERKLATRHVKDAIEKLYVWVLLKKKQILFSEARVLGLGPKFMSVYIPKASHGEAYILGRGGWPNGHATSTLVFSHPTRQKRSPRKSSPRKCRAIEDVALVVSPTKTKQLRAS